MEQCFNCTHTYDEHDNGGHCLAQAIDVDETLICGCTAYEHIPEAE